MEPVSYIFSLLRSWSSKYPQFHNQKKNISCRISLFLSDRTLAYLDHISSLDNIKNISNQDILSPEILGVSMQIDAT